MKLSYRYPLSVYNRRGLTLTLQVLTLKKNDIPFILKPTDISDKWSWKIHPQRNFRTVIVARLPRDSNGYKRYSNATFTGFHKTCGTYREFRQFLFEFSYIYNIYNRHIVQTNGKLSASNLLHYKMPIVTLTWCNIFFTFVLSNYNNIARGF